MEQVVLVDSEDNEIGVCEKMEAHQKGLLHRAFSVFLFNDRKEWLLQQRADGKYHSGGLWTNACCSHPRPGETVTEAAKRRLLEEIGINAEPKQQFSFQYQCDFENGLVESELDHVLIGKANSYSELNLEEVQQLKYVDFNSLQYDIQQNPKKYTFWFKLIYERVWAELNAN